jgi:hypothetical protein
MTSIADIAAVSDPIGLFPSSRTDSGLDLHTKCCPQICQPASSANEFSTDDNFRHQLFSTRPQYEHHLLIYNDDDQTEAA